MISSWDNPPSGIRFPKPFTAPNGGKYTAYAAGLEAQFNYEPAQRDGVVGTAKSMVQTLKFVGTLQWVNPISAADTRPQFSPQQFVRDARDTLYVLSKEGGGSAAALAAPHGLRAGGPPLSDPCPRRG